MAQTQAQVQTQSSPKPSIEDKILHVLDIYPVISPSMLHIGIGSIPTPLWKPILRKLINEGVVLSEELDTTTVTGRNFTYTRLSLVPSPCDTED